MHKFIKTNLFLASFLVTHFNSYGAQYTYLAGQVEQSQDGSSYVLVVSDLKSKQNAVLPYVRTKNGWAIIELNHGTKIKLSPGSILKILKDDVSEQSLKLEVGAAFFKVLKSSEATKKFKLSTKVTTMGVRGTEFFVSYGTQKHKTHTDEWMCVNEGSVVLKDHITMKQVAVNQGQGVLVDAHEGVTNPKEYEWTKKLNWRMTTDEGKIESDVDLNNAYTNLRRIIYE